MKLSRFSIRRKGWIGIPIFVIGLATFAFSQLEFSDDEVPGTAEELIQQIELFAKLSKDKISRVQNKISRFSFEGKKLEIARSLDTSVQRGQMDIEQKKTLTSSLSLLENDWENRSLEFIGNLDSIMSNINRANGIYEDLADSYAGRMEEATPTLRTLYKNLRTANEQAEAVEKSASTFIDETNYDLQSLASGEIPKLVGTPKNDLTQNRSRMSSIINADEAVPLSPIPMSMRSIAMKQELAKARSSVESLRSNLKESEVLIADIQKDKELLSGSYNSGKSDSELIGDEIGRLRNNFDDSRSELSKTRQTMLAEQQNSSAIVRTVTAELERTRAELNSAREKAFQAQTDGNNLAKIASDIQSIKTTIDRSPSGNGSELDPSVLAAISGDLDRSLKAIMKLNAGPAGQGETALNPQMDPALSGNELVNKVLVDLNTAKQGLVEARSENRKIKQSLNGKILALEDELKSTNLELIRTVRGYEESKMQMAKREFEFADTIKKLEEEAQVAQNALSDASIGKLPAIPFIEEMERNLIESEKRIESLSQRFDSEKEQASEVIDGLQVELENANLRQKRAMEQLGRRELELKGKDQELMQLVDERKTLQEELEVVKVISGQLQDLNNVLEDTKKAQNINSINTDQMVLSLRDELNQAKVELVYEREEKEKMAKDASMKINSLEGQLQNSKDKLLSEQENLVEQTMQSKDLIFDLKAELDSAREEIARMKSVGNTDSLEAQKAVAQLQEALGTIRILKESLEESEKASFELDSLRSELADSMERQIAQVKNDEDQKSRLNQKISDLEAEILIFRNKEDAEGVQTKKLVADLNEKLRQSQAEVSKLNTQLELSEDTGISNLILIQEELAQKEALSQDLQKQIESIMKENAGSPSSPITGNEGDMRTQLEAKLLEALEEIKLLNSPESKPISGNNSLNREMVGGLEQSLSDAETSFTNLEKELLRERQSKQKALDDLNAANLKLRRFQDSADSVPYLDNLVVRELEDSLAKAETSAASLEQELGKQKSISQKAINDLEVERAKLAALNSANDQNKSTEFLVNSFSKINLLEQSLSDALDKLEVMEAEEGEAADSEISQEAMVELEESLNLSEATVAQLQDELLEQKKFNDDAQSELAAIKVKLAVLDQADSKNVDQPNQPMKMTETFLQMEEELMSARVEVEMLKKQNDEEADARKILEEKLEDAIAKEELADLSQSDPIGSQELQELREELSANEENLQAMKQKLFDAVDELNEKEAELELSRTLVANISSDSNESDVIDGLNRELVLLRDELEKARTAKIKNENQAVSLNPFQEKLEQAVAESLELQSELEETKSRLALMENQQNPNVELRSQFAKLLDESQANERKAISEIESLSSALKNSEAIRDELEMLLQEFQEISENEEDLASSPKIIKLQQELLLLEEGLKQARDYQDPRVVELEAELAVVNKDKDNLDEDFKNAMKDFVRLKNQVEMFEIENERLRKEDIANLRSDAEKEIISLKNQIAGLRDQNSFLNIDLQGRNQRLADLREQLVQSQNRPSFSGSPDNSQLRSKVIRLEGDVQIARDGELKQKRLVDGLNLELAQSRERIATLEQSLRNAMNSARSIQPASIARAPTPSLSNSQIVELETLKQQNQRLQDQLASASVNSERDLFDQKVQELNQRNLTVQVQLDQERRRSLGLEAQLEEAQNIKRGIIEKGESANLKVGLLNEELSSAQNRMKSLEKALMGAREAIRVLQNGGNERSMINVKLGNSNSYAEPERSSLSRPNLSGSREFPIYTPRTSRFGAPSPSINSSSTSKVNQFPTGNASLEVKAEVQFLNNRSRPASFTEFFLVEDSLKSILESARIKLPRNQGIDSYGELWARSVQRGYRFPGVAANIRNALASSSLMRLKTNSVGSAKLNNVQPGKYFLVGSSPLGQVGVVWSTPIDVNEGFNNIALGLNNTNWAE
jgi:hypothetical protein